MKFALMYNKTCLVAMVSILSVILTACHKEEVNSSRISIVPPTVTVSRPLQKEVTNFANFSGIAEPLKSVVIRARKEGILEKIHFKPGESVKKDDLLFSIESQFYQAKLKKTEAELAVREAELKVAMETITRLENAYKNNAVSEMTIIEAEAKLSIAEASVSATKADVDMARLDLSYTRIKAPISGIIDRNFVDIGNLVGANEHTALTSIIQTNPIYAYFRITEQDLLYFNQIINVKSHDADSRIPVLLGLRGEEDYPFQGYIDYVDNCIDVETGTIQIRAIFPNQEQSLLPGSFARIKIPIGKPTNQLLIPDKAFGLDQQGKYLLLVDTDNKVSYQPVTVGALINGMRVVSKGLSSDDLVIINGIQKVLPGFPITPQEEILSIVVENTTTTSQ